MYSVKQITQFDKTDAPGHQNNWILIFVFAKKL